MIFKPENDEFDWTELLPSFIESAEENLNVLSGDLLNLEGSVGDPDMYEEIYRRAHNLKGSAYTIGFQDLGDLAHSMENVLKAYFQRQRTPASADIDLLIAGVDMLKSLLDELKKNGWADDREPELLALKKQFNNLLCTPELKNKLTQTAGETKAIDRKAQKPDNCSQPEKEKKGVRPSEISFDSVRVKTVYLEKIMNLLGELVILKNTQADCIKYMEMNRKKTHFFFAEFQDYQNRIINDANSVLSEENKIRCREFSKKGAQIPQDLDVLFNGTHENFERFCNLIDQLEKNVVNIRMVPFSMVFRGFQRTIRDFAREFGKEIRYIQEGGETQIDRGILEGLIDPITHLIRNSIDHGIEKVEERRKAGKPEKGTIRIAAIQENARVKVIVEDDGRGIDVELIRQTALRKKMFAEDQLQGMNEHEILDLIFEAGFSTKEVANQISGRGVGMSVVKHNIPKLNGEISLETQLGHGTKIILSLPLTLLISRALLMKAGQWVFAIPTSFVKQILTFRHSDLVYFSNRPVLYLGKEPVALATIQEILLGKRNGYFGKLNKPYDGILVQANNQKLVICVDQILDEQGIVTKSLGTHIKHIPKISGSTVLSDGSLGFILDVPAVLRQARENSYEAGVSEILTEKRPEEVKHHAKGRHILLVEDELATQQLEKSILESVGYTVEIANNGLEALGVLDKVPVDLVITDINMPEIDGLKLTEIIRKKAQLSHLPVIVVSSLDNMEDKQKGISVGADAYISKNKFSRGELVEIVKSFME
ncbi:gliding motility regulatory protein [bacterium BMS3Abin05]|nr:gliding motility regulatory protein [bacterium BMS3Abin05]GBE28565.1 gliding motility regulatory protein [bacterium BMS3Bbin03]HDL78454.1 hybrid sensor histidine kinase/response regulator [Bacteroidota bacterium]HDZ12339.1 hybrid sensor histidine kinase/response regulator [Bacteroidota bacterium]